MKKTKYILMLSMAGFLSSLSLTSCGGGELEQVQKYNVSTKDVEGATVSTSLTEASAGEEVTITINVTDETKEISAVYANNLGVAKDSSGAYKFLMPSEDVEVNVVLTEKVISTFSVTLPSDPVGYTITSDKTTAKVGEEVSLTITVTDETKLIGTVLANDLALAKSSDGTYKFTMPSENVTISVTLVDVETETLYTITAPTVEGATVTLSKTSAYAGEVIDVTVEVTDETKVVDTLVANDVTLGLGSDGKYKLVMPEANVTLTLTLKNVEVTPTYSLTLPEETEDYSVTASKTTGLLPGEQVDLTVNLLNEKKMITTLSFNGLPLAYDPSLPTQVVRVIMPEDDATLVIEVSDDPLKVEYDLTYDASDIEGYYSAKFINSEGETITSAMAGEEVGLVVDNIEETQTKEISRVRIIEGNNTGTWYDYDELGFSYYYDVDTAKERYTFTMPEGTLHFEFTLTDKSYDINFEEEDKVSFAETEIEAQPGDNVYINGASLGSYVITGYQVVNDKTDETIEIITSGSGENITYRFTMPASSVTITPLLNVVSYPVIVETSEHIAVSAERYYFNSETTYVEGIVNANQEGGYLMSAPATSDVYFSIGECSDPNYMFAEYVVTNLETGEEITRDDTIYSPSFEMPSAPVKITISEKTKYIDVTVRVVTTDGTTENELASENYTLEIGEYNYSEGTISTIGKTLRDDDRTGIKIDATDALGDKTINVVGVRYGEQTGGYISRNGAYYWLWTDLADYTDDSVEFTVIVEIKDNIFSADSVFIGNYLGTSIIPSGYGWSGSSVERNYLNILRTGEYYLGTSSTGTPSNTLVLLEETNTLVDEDNSRTIIYDDNYAFVKGSSLENSYLLKKGETSVDTSAYDYALTSNEQELLVSQTYGSTTHYVYVNLETNTMYTDITITGTPFSSNSIVTLTQSNGTKIGDYKFTSSDEMESIVLDEYGGTYTAKEGTTDLGTLIIDGAAGGTLNNRTISYTINDSTITLIVGGESSYCSYRYVLTLDKDAKTYDVGTTVTEPFFNESKTTYTSNVISIDGVNYILQILQDYDKSLQFKFGVVQDDGSVIYGNNSSTSWCRVIIDMTTGLTEIDPYSYSYFESGAETISVTISSEAITISGTFSFKGSPTFTLNNYSVPLNVE